MAKRTRSKKASAAEKPGVSRPPYVVPTLGRVAEFFGVAVQTVKEWRKDPSMPGAANAWPLDEIARWKIAKAQRSDRSESDNGKPSARDMVAERRAQLLDLEIAQGSGRVVDVDFVARLLERHIAVHHSLADDLRDKVLGLLPKSIAGEARKRIATGVEKAVGDLRFSMATAVEEWELGEESETDR